MVDIMLDLARLRETKDGLAATVAEFESAAKTNDGLEQSIGKPDDRSELRDKASDFESAWNDKRDKLKENLENILEQLSGIVDGWEEWDRDTACSLDGAEATGTVNAQVAL
ncbi:flagellar protein FlgN [Microbacterium sulfonylureivorans]|uniref:flagellar protein FlgN n=1 Tax=Microbacterium sulfonylureivorans TaxID=2486854 RepID=UPI000FDADA00|nr:flagellar protein FlgN [Microbacterium sulfonylureivorans]